MFKSCLPTIANGCSETQLHEQQQANHVVAVIINRCCHMFFVAIGIWLDSAEWPFFEHDGFIPNEIVAVPIDHVARCGTRLLAFERLLSYVRASSTAHMFVTRMPPPPMKSQVRPSVLATIFRFRVVHLFLWRGRTRQTSPYSLCAECAAGSLRASSAGRSGRSATGGA